MTGASLHASYQGLAATERAELALVCSFPGQGGKTRSWVNSSCVPIVSSVGHRDHDADVSICCVEPCDEVGRIYDGELMMRALKVVSQKMDRHPRLFST